MILTQVVYIDNILRNTTFIPNSMFSEETEPQVVSSNGFLKDLQKKTLKKSWGAGSGVGREQTDGCPWCSKQKGCFASFRYWSHVIIELTSHFTSKSIYMITLNKFLALELLGHRIWIFECFWYMFPKMPSTRLMPIFSPTSRVREKGDPFQHPTK